VGRSYSSGHDKLLNQCLSVRPKFTCPVMENSLFCKISRSRCLPNLSPEDRDIPFPGAFFLGIPDGGQVPKPSVTYRRQNPLFLTSETSNFPYRFFFRLYYFETGLNTGLSFLVIFIFPKTVFLISAGVAVAVLSEV
jgi:hypothetical protein